MMTQLLTKTIGMLLIIACGYMLKQMRILQAQDARILSKMIIYLTLPGALIMGFKSFTFHFELLLLVALALVANILLLMLGARVSWGKPDDVRALYMLSIPSYNIGTFAMPFMQSLLPAEAMLSASMFDVGNCPMNSGLSYAMLSKVLNGKQMKLKQIGFNLLHSVPLMTFLTMLLLTSIGVHFPEPFFSVAGMFGQANIFVAMLMIGVMFEPHIDKTRRAVIGQIVLLRYGANLLFAAAALLWLPLPSQVRLATALVLVAPIPTMSLTYCEKAGCDAVLVSAVHSVCIPLSLILTLSLLLFA